MQKLNGFFTDGITSQALQTVGAEVETQFVDQVGSPITTPTSQQIMKYLAKHGWTIDCRKGNLVTTLVDPSGNKIFYELGRHNIEVATTASTTLGVLGVVKRCLDQLYEAANVWVRNRTSRRSCRETKIFWSYLIGEMQCGWS